ncbi:right-handed parallel beta-helix repeat-containing protein [Streptomyces sp. DSM 44917]|uniref:Right-handed parallel beta-helix repeat-containing protein n=1 Tax=Streptomyces boetiae TaxID=3075541 RepID=A0ABU2LA55_9ACTN|nr:right-handed parallel beta-helix repeat-containing protein [Streptomyces sp. DSM 44917]MDT0308382.1 right-handed parallel beta-helix repeat-containing protein [Streptomyces sp. DSM 44917]
MPWRPRTMGAALLALPLLAAVPAVAGEVPDRAGAPAAQLYVAPWGDDAWPGTEGRPFATPARAQQAVRALADGGEGGDEGASARGEVIVHLRGGTYRLDRPLDFDGTAGDSGAGGHRVVYQAYGFGTPRQERVTLSGGREVTGWEPAGGGLWRAEVGDLDTRQLYVDGRRAPRAAAREVPELHPTEAGFVTESTAPQEWERPGDVELVHTFADSYSEGRCGVASVRGDATGTEVVMDQPCHRRARDIYAELYGADNGQGLIPPTAVENDPSFLPERPGSWYLDRSEPGRHVLYLNGRPRGGVVAPVLERLVTGRGTAGEPLHDLALRGLEFTEAGWTAPSGPDGFPHIIGTWYYTGEDPTAQEAATMPAALSFSGARDLSFEGNRFTRLGASALELAGRTRDIEIRANTVEDVSGGGFHVQSADEDPAAAPRGIEVVDNWVHHAGRDYRGSWGILLNQTHDSLIAHNEVAHIPYSGIAHLNVAGDGTTTGGLRITDNLVHHTNSVLIDGGGIYGNGPQGPSFEEGALVERNVVHHADGPAATAAEYPPYALYPDDGGDMVTYRDNVLFANQASVGGVAPRGIRFEGTFLDDESAYWWEGDGEQVEFAGSTRLSPLAPRADCRARPACAAVLDGAGLLSPRR